MTHLEFDIPSWLLLLISTLWLIAAFANLYSDLLKRKIEMLRKQLSEDKS